MTFVQSRQKLLLLLIKVFILEFIELKVDFYLKIQGAKILFVHCAYD